jgi:flavodoxin
MFKIVTLSVAIIAWPLAATKVETIEKPSVKPVAFHITPELVAAKKSVAKQTDNMDTATLKHSSWYAAALKNLAKQEYTFKPAAEAGLYVTPNRRNNLHFTYSDKGFTVKPQTTKIPTREVTPGMLPEEIKYKTLPDWKIAFNLDKKQIGEGEWRVSENKAEYVTSNITVQYINNEEGMRQNFIVQAPTAAGADEKIVFNIATNLQVKTQPNGLQFANKEGVVMNYNQLKAWDANGQALEASFGKSKGDYCIQVQSKNAVYPITIDPLSATPSAILEVNQAGAKFGTSVASAGDVNGDGYSDVIIGAPSYSNFGRAFIYHGSAAGLSTTPAIWFDGEPGSNFGWSVSTAGDVNGDGYSDVIIGAPNMNWGQPAEGAILVFYGSATGLNPASIYGLKINRPNAHLGWSVACAGDVNNDGYSDVIVGAPDYDLSNFPNEDGGLVFIYRGSPTGLDELVRTVIYNNQRYNGADKFGFSVAGAGDVNGDGYSDVIVGAYNYYSTAYVNGLFSVFYGNAGGVNTTPSFTQKAGYALGGQTWLGYSVACAGDVNGDGYSDVIIGHPYSINASVGVGSFGMWYGSASGLTFAGGFNPGPSQAGANMGWSVASAGDINGDGYSDVLVGANMYDNGNTNEGAAWVYYGSATGIPTSGGGVLIAEGNQDNALLGAAVASAGDVNGDGYSDVLIGAYMYDKGETDEGVVFLFNGSPGGLNPSNSRFIESNSAGALMGSSVAFAGDVNGDGYNDLIIGFQNYSNGQSYEGAFNIYHGSATGIPLTPATSIEMNQAFTTLGYAVAGAGDVNGDGYADVIVGAPNYSNGNNTEGMFRIYHGSATGLLTTPAVTIEGNQDFAQMGVSVASAGDVNGDGYSDVIVGANNYSNGQANEGVAFVYHGSATGINPTAAALLERNQAGAQFGNSVASAGDVNGDGFGDVVVGARNYTNGQTNEGVAFVYKGSATGINIAIAPVMLEANQASAEFGTVVRGAGDLNHDGYSDVLVSSPAYTNGSSQEGAVFVFNGSSGGINTTAATRIESNIAGLKLGGALSAGDVNGDGYNDIIVGAPVYSNVQTNEGALYVYHGSASGVSITPALKIENDWANSRLGSSVAVADVNGDGYNDVVVGCPGYANGQADEGAIYVYHGNSPGNGLRNNLILYNANLTIPLSSSSYIGDKFGIGLYAKSLVGKTKGKLVWETRSISNAFSGTPVTNSTLYTSGQSAMTDISLNGQLKAVVSKIMTSRYTKIRARVKYDPATAITGQLYGPWRYVTEQAAGASLGVLPVDLISFKAEWLQRGKTAQLKFITENESNLCCYEMEKSSDGVHFTSIGKLTAKNNSLRNDYSYTDPTATAPKQYYRLKTINLNGIVEYSNLQLLRSNTAIEVIVFPNPASNVLQLQLNNNYTTLNAQIINPAGQTIQRYTNLSTAGQLVTIPISNLAQGTYFLHLQCGEEKQVLQFIKK